MPPSNNNNNIGPVVSDNYAFLRTLSRTRSMQRRRRLLKKANTHQLLALAEICLNIVRNRFRLTTRQKMRMVPFVDFIRRLSRVRSERGARKLVIQKGSGLGINLFPALLTPIIYELSKRLLQQQQ